MWNKAVTSLLSRHICIAHKICNVLRSKVVDFLTGCGAYVIFHILWVMAHNWSMNLFAMVHEVLGETDYYFHMISCENIFSFSRRLNVQYTKFFYVSVFFLAFAVFLR